MSGAEGILVSGVGSGSRRGRYAALAVIGLALLGYNGLAGWRANHAMLINATSSLPNWAFVIDKQRRPARGNFIFFDPPPSALLKRHFGADLKPFGKIVYGVGGDRVEAQGRLFFVNQRPVALAKPATRLGEPLALGPTGIIPRGCYFVGTPHKDSFDSRYAAIGWICSPRVIGVGEAIL